MGIGKLYRDARKHRIDIISMLKTLFCSKDEKVRQTVVYTLGEIGNINFEDIIEILELAFNYSHHSVLNAVTGALKQLGGKNKKSTLKFVKKKSQHCDSTIRLKLLDGLELRGRTHPDVLPILTEYQNESQKKVVNMIIHIIGQICYKEGCLEKVIQNIKYWGNFNLIDKALKEIIDVHQRYSKFSYLSPEEAQNIIKREFKIT